jgi:hypothetical protein
MRVIKKLLPVAVSFIVIHFVLRLDYNSISTVKDVMKADIGFSMSAMGFFLAGVSILQTSSASPYYKILKDLGTDRKIVSWLMASIAYMFLLSSFSILGLFFGSVIPKQYYLFFDIWLSLLSASILSMLYVIMIFLIVFTRK